MSTFTIDDNNITASARAEQASEVAGLIHFDSQATLAKVAADWPLSQLVEIWNSIPGQTPVKKFQDRNKAVARVWNAIQSLAGEGQSESAPEPPQARAKSAEPIKLVQPTKKMVRAKKTRRAKAADDTTGERRNKKAEVIMMMKRAKGATMAEIMEATQWQKHTVRGFVSLLSSKSGLTIESSKNAGGERTYNIAN